MKSPVYILTAILPFATQVALANPVAEPADDLSLEMRRNGGGWGWGWDWGKDHDHDHDHDHGEDPHHEHPEHYCTVKKPYWYHKYPCESSETVGKSKRGDTFAPVCEYHNWYQNSKGWWVKKEHKPWHCHVDVEECP